MVDSRPTASVTGREDWEWNRWRAGRHSQPPAPRSSSPERRAVERPTRPRQPAVADSPDLRALAVELEQTQRRLEAVIERYERLLAEKNRRLEAAREKAPQPRPVRAIVQGVRRLIA